MLRRHCDRLRNFQTFLFVINCGHYQALIADNFGFSAKEKEVHLPRPGFEPGTSRKDFHRSIKVAICSSFLILIIKEKTAYYLADGKWQLFVTFYLTTTILQIWNKEEFSKLKYWTWWDSNPCFNTTALSSIYCTTQQPTDYAINY